MKPNKKTVVIIGSGLSGLLCGNILGKAGYKVVILEQHFVAGGLLQNFTRNGLCFDTGIHYIGDMDKGSVLNKLWHYFGLLPKVKLKKLDESGFDIIKIGNQEYKYAMGKDNFIESLSKDFPNHRNEISLYVEKMYEITKQSIFYQDNPNVRNLIDAPFLNISIEEFMNDTIQDERLKNVLLGNLLLSAGESAKTPIYLESLLKIPYISSAYRILGGSAQIAEILSENILKNGGEIHLNSNVTKIEGRDNQIDFVELDSGKRYFADDFISTMHPAMTLQMMNPGLMRKCYRERISQIENTKALLTLYLHFKEEQMPYQNYNYFYFEDDSFVSRSKDTMDKAENVFLYMHQCEEENQKYARMGSVSVYFDYDKLEKWKDGKPGKRGVEYDFLIKEQAERILQKMEAIFPGFRSTVKEYYTASPLTYEYYTRTPKGSAYGTFQDVNKPLGGVILHLSKVSNMYFSGQNTYAHGVLGVTIGALITCGEFIDLNELLAEVKGMYV